MKHIKKFNDLNEGFFSLKERIFKPLRLKKIAEKYFNICKNDEELLRLVGNFISEYPSYSEGPDPRTASENLRNKINELFPETNNKELYELTIVRSGLTEFSDITTAYNYLVWMLIEWWKKNN